jgi:hypothetical protein
VEGARGPPETQLDPLKPARKDLKTQKRKNSE